MSSDHNINSARLEIVTDIHVDDISNITGNKFTDIKMLISTFSSLDLHTQCFKSATLETIYQVTL